jgi:hypothetical protein
MKKSFVKLSEYFVLLVVKTKPQRTTKEITKEHKEEHSATAEHFGDKPERACEISLAF